MVWITDFKTNLILILPKQKYSKLNFIKVIQNTFILNCFTYSLATII